MQTRRSKPRGCVKHVRAVSCVSIKADKCSVQLMSSQIATMRDRGAPRSGAAGRPGCGEGQSGAGGPRSGSVGRAWAQDPSFHRHPSLPCGRSMLPLKVPRRKAGSTWPSEKPGPSPGQSGAGRPGMGMGNPGGREHGEKRQERKRQGKKLRVIDALFLKPQGCGVPP